MVETQVRIEFARRSPLGGDELDHLADACLGALNREARFLAFGPVISADYSRSAIELECTLSTTTEAEVEDVIERINSIMRNALAASEYATTAHRAPVPA